MTLSTMHLLGIKSPVEEKIKILKKNTRSCMNFSETNVGSKDAQKLANAVETNTRLQMLALYNSKIKDEGATAIAKALEKNTKLTSLLLGRNKITDDGASAFADALKRNGTLLKLRFQDNNIGSAGARALADALKENTTLTELNLKGNAIGDEGARALADALKENTTLTELNLEENSIGNVGVRALAEALEKNNTLARLDLIRNKIGTVGARAIADALENNNTITYLSVYDVTGMRTIQGEKERIKNYIERNKTFDEELKAVKAKTKANTRKRREKGRNTQARLRRRATGNEQIIAPENCKVMISFNDFSAGRDAEKLANYLTSNDHPTFCTRLYCHNHSGSWRNVTIAGVNNCQYYVLLLTNGWQKSNECQFETEIAVNRRARGDVKFIPVWYKDFDDNLDMRGDSEHKAQYYNTMFQSIQSVYRMSDDWMQDILKLLQE